MRTKDWSKAIAGLALIAPAAWVARADTYLTESQALNVLFPGVKLEPRVIDLTAEEMKSIRRLSGERVLVPQVKSWWGPGGEALIVDEVLGKHEFIVYAVAISSAGAVKGIEIMDYRETYGYEV